MISKTVLALSVAATAGTMMSTPAAAVVSTFATFSSATSARNIRYVNSGNSAARLTDATVYTTTTGTSTTPGSVLVNFSFLIPQLAPYVTNAMAFYTLNGTIAKNTPVVGSPNFVQGGYSGSFSFVSKFAITVGGPDFIPHTYAAGSNLLSGTFSAGTFTGTIGGNAGSSFSSGLSGTTITYTSDFLDFSGAVSLDRATSLSAVLSAFSKHLGPNGSLSSFRAVTGGQFSSDPVPIVNGLATVPEPRTWALMIVGFGLVGATLRRRSAATA